MTKVDGKTIDKFYCSMCYRFCTQKVRAMTTVYACLSIIGQKNGKLSHDLFKSLCFCLFWGDGAGKAGPRRSKGSKNNDEFLAFLNENKGLALVCVEELDLSFQIQ